MATLWSFLPVVRGLWRFMEAFHSFPQPSNHLRSPKGTALPNLCTLSSVTLVTVNTGYVSWRALHNICLSTSLLHWFIPWSISGWSFSNVFILPFWYASFASVFKARSPFTRSFVVHVQEMGATLEIGVENVSPHAETHIWFCCWAKRHKHM